MESLEFGKEGTKLRLVESESGKTRYIQLWSSLSKQWNTAYRYNIEIEWQKWKKLHARIYAKGPKKSRPVGRDVQLGRTTDNAKRTTRRKAGAVSPKDSKQPNGKQRSKSTGRIQGSAKK